MRPGTRDTAISVEQAVKAGVNACEGEFRREDDGLAALVRSFEGDERPATAAEDLGGELASAAEQIDPEGREPAVLVAAAAAHWIGTNPDASSDPERAIQHGMRLLFGAEPPESVRRWLSERDLA